MFGFLRRNSKKKIQARIQALEKEINLKKAQIESFEKKLTKLENKKKTLEKFEEYDRVSQEINDDESLTQDQIEKKYKGLKKKFPQELALEEEINQTNNLLQLNKSDLQRLERELKNLSS